MNGRKVLIYRLGSLGDTVVALPSLHLVARAFPDAERRILTNFPVSGKVAPMESVIGGSGLVHGYFRYPLGTRNPNKLWSLRQEIGRWSPDILIYLAATRGRFNAYRDALFFRSCGIRDLIGVPYSKDQQENRKLDGSAQFESEADRLARCIGDLGGIDLADSGSWDLHLTEAEVREARGLLRAEMPAYLTVSIGAKVVVKDWGDTNWTQLLTRISAGYPEIGLVLVGASDERDQSSLIAANWNGPILNLCGMAPPRIIAAVLKRSILFVGHDSGPMHLAATTGVPCVAIFSARNKPGVWFPAGSGHQVIYHHVDCYGCGLDQCDEFKKKCIASVSVDEVFEAVSRQLDLRSSHGGFARLPGPMGKNA
jgi:ADP-heptose:LPS heptosyltransferase